MWNFGNKKLTLPDPEEALVGRVEGMTVPEKHAVLGTPLQGPWPEGLEVAYFGMGCFWGAEELFWQVPGVHSTAVGYQGGITPNPTYEETCSGRTGHTESVLVVFDPAVVSYEQLLKVFWEHHDPTQGMRQGNDIGTQYRSALYTTTHAQSAAALASRETYQKVLTEDGLDEISTEILPAGPFYYAEPYHQQYLDKNPNGYRCHASTGVTYPG
jgi:peptide-methionine (S)-S-oxide reductase